MTTDRAIQHMLRNPRDMMRFQATGALPTLASPQSPLITLLESIYPRDCQRITAVVIGPQLGYQGHHRFHNLAQALNWLKPSYTAQSYPSQSYQNWAFFKALTIADLKEFARVPEQIEQEWNRRFNR
ncbi:hypothetical protein [Pseudomonas baetica]|uniref:hypothetical protein n=1 Tax=Pseudomonas baetica TaxID=674054 RepID=UPI0024065102|nr:hypothetical protein [Pseudomonas baetica]MDF9779108.1 hypothetical protein [Pseudomonas baetica]